MKTKKTSGADLERKRGLFFSLGLVLCSSAILMAFTYSSVVDNTQLAQEEIDGLEEEYVYTIPEEPEVKPPPPIVEEIEIVEDEEEIDEIDFSDIEDIEELPPEDPEEKEIEDEPLILVPDIEPTFKGGEAEMAKYINDNIHFPDDYNEIGEKGTIYIQFVVNKDGSIVQTKILRGLYPSIDQEALRVVKSMPKWIPGEQAGKKVKCQFTLPIRIN